MQWVRDKSFYKTLISIAVPIALQNLITQATGIMDTIMLGQADNSGVLLSASSLANQPFFILSLICFGLSGGASVLAAQYWGKRDMATIRIVVSMAMKVAAVIAFLIGLLVLCCPEWVMRLYSNDTAIVKAGADYLRILGFAYVFFGVGNTLLCIIRSIELVRISVLVNLLSFVTNVFLNWLLIFGNGGLPAMGIRGAAIATLVARLLEFAVTMVYILAVDKRLRFRWRDFRLFDKTLFTDWVRHGSPVLFNEMMWGIGISLQAAILGHITYAAGDPVAANSLAGIVQQLSSIVIFGVANAAAVLVGKAIGEGNQPEARRRAFTLKWMSILVGFLAAGLIMALRPLLVMLYDLPAATMELASALIAVVALNAVFVSISSVSIVGILRGAGDTRFCLVMEMIALWGVALPLAFLASSLGWPVPAVLFLMKIDEPVKSLACFWRLRGQKWLNLLTRDFGTGGASPAAKAEAGSKHG